MELQALKQRFGILGNTPSLNYALNIAQQVAPTDLSVLITGESGVGKEVFSHVIHQLSARKHSPFIAVNCGAIPEGTIDSELFGHEKGSFTGATDARKGYFETVNGGTIFLDEIAEMPLGTQARLLRVLETGEFIKVGSSKVLKTNVRVVAATNVSLKDSVQFGKFREDLFYRLNTVPIKVPPLRERRDDILILFRKFSIDFADKYRSEPISLTESAKQILLAYSWPGNIRELKNVAEQCSVLAPNKEMDSQSLMQFMPDGQKDSLPALSNMNPINNSNQFSNEREIMYKLLFDMKKDVNDLKSAFSNIISGQVTPDEISQAMNNNYTDQNNNIARPIGNSNQLNYGLANSHSQLENNRPILLEATPEIEESLNLMDREKEIIIKALKKHKSHRKDAANELGISERTLYRKIKEYDLDGM
jgi:DNA-binding NtrC family response regulator